MRRVAGIAIVGAFCFATGLLSWAPAVGQEEAGRDDTWIETFTSISDTVIQHHVDPPTRQEMLLSAARFVYEAAETPMPRETSRRVSDLRSDEEVAAFIRELRRLSGDGPPGPLLSNFARGIVAPVSGSVGLLPGTEVKIQQQLRDNMYVGIGIQLAQHGDLPFISKAFPAGPAARGGVRDGDTILEIDGEPTRGKDLRTVVDELRGAKGTTLSILVKQADEDDPRLIELVRDVVPFQTVMGHTSTGELEWDYRVPADPRIAYVKIESIRGSTVREFQEVAARLHAEGFKALVLDLRQTADGEIRYTSLLADELLGDCIIGRVVEPRGVREYKSRPASLFGGWPVAVLVSAGSRGSVEWLAAAIQDQRVGVLVGEPTAGAHRVAEMLELPGLVGGIVLDTRVLQRADGRPLSIDRPAAQPPHIPLPPGVSEFEPAMRGRAGVVPDVEAPAGAALERAVEKLAEQLEG